MSLTRRVRIALLWILAGLLLQLAATLHWTPLTFVVLETPGLGAVVIGAVWFAWTVWRYVGALEQNKERPPR